MSFLATSKTCFIQHRTLLFVILTAPGTPLHEPLVVSSIVLARLGLFGTLGSKMSHLVTIVTCSGGHRAIFSFMLSPASETLHVGLLIIVVVVVAASTTPLVLITENLK